MFEDYPLDVAAAAQMHWILQALAAAQRDDPDEFTSIIAAHGGSPTEVLEMASLVRAIAADRKMTYEAVMDAMRAKAAKVLATSDSHPPTAQTHRNGTH